MSKGTAAKIALIMEADSGKGKASSAILADKGYQAVISCLDEGQGWTAYGVTTDVSGRMVDLMLYDPWGMGSIRVFVRCFRERFDRLDVLVNNAGAITPDRRETADGLELQFGVNRIVHLLLTIPPWDLQERSG